MEGIYMSIDDVTTKRIENLELENNRLRKAVEELSVLNEIAVQITSTKEIDSIVDQIVQRCVKHLKVEQGAVMLLDEQDKASSLHTMIRKADTTQSKILPFRLDTQLTGWMLKNRKPLLVNDLKQDDRFQITGKTDWPINSVLGVPLLTKGKMIGVLTVFNKRTPDGFSLDDQRLLSIISAQSAQIIENARLYQEEQALLLMQKELRFAKDIQVNLLPHEMPQIPGYQVAGKSIPASDIGGDYFDFIKKDENHIAFCLGDVSGKGLPAALLMANLQATLRGQTMADIPIKECIGRSNTLIHRSTDMKKFATLFYGLLDFKNHQLQYCNAGHDNPFHFTQQEIKRLKTGGVVLGFVPQFSYEETKIPVKSGDLFLIYSDGVTEAMNASEEEFGEERLVEIIKQNKSKTSMELIDEIIDAVNHHAGSEPQMDDMTLVVVKKE
jgi:sigma-B regulation protein RsbU (phosphoserine phosphatase)